MRRKFLERIGGDAVLHAACLLGCHLRVHPGIEEHPLEKAVLGEGLLGKELSGCSQTNVTIDHLNKR